MSTALARGHAEETVRPAFGGAAPAVDGSQVHLVPDLVTLYRQHCRFVWTSLYRLGVREDDLEDMLQEVFVVVHRRMAEFDPARATVRTWLFHICRGVASNYRRTRQTRRATMAEGADTEEVSGNEPDPEEAAARTEARARLEAILDEMSFEKRITFLMYEVDRLSTEEIAAILRIERGTVHSRLHAARQEFERSVRRMRLLDDVKEKP